MVEMSMIERRLRKTFRTPEEAGNRRDFAGAAGGDFGNGGRTECALPPNYRPVRSGVFSVLLTRGMVALIDEPDIDLVAGHNWHAKVWRGLAYAITSIPRIGEDGRKKRVRDLGMHRLLMGDPPGMVIDHIDGDGLNNTRANLRVCTHRSNTHNRSAQRGSTSPFLGVELRAPEWRGRKPFRAVIGKRFIGGFATEIEAALAYDQAARDLYGEFARLNFPNAAPPPRQAAP